MSGFSRILEGERPYYIPSIQPCFIQGTILCQLYEEEWYHMARVEVSLPLHLLPYQDLQDNNTMG
jgi:hypothetical protein